MTAPEDWVWLALIRRPQGRKGEVFADLLTDFPEKFAERRQLWLVAAEAPPAMAKDTPATPNTGTALLRRFRLEACFAFDILLVSHTFKPGFTDGVQTYHHSYRFA